MNKSYEFSAKDLISIQTALKHQELTNLEYANDVKQNISLLLELLNSLYEEKIIIAEWLFWIEPMVHKLAFHSSTILQLFEGTNFSVSNRNFKIFDEPSAIALFRTALENYLTIYYLFFDKITDEEKIFRSNVWKYCGLKQRNDFVTVTENASRKKAKEAVQINNLKQQIIASPTFAGFNEKEKKTILGGKKPRLFYGWNDLIKKAEFRENLLRNLYGYKSNYSHSEFISALQIKDGTYGFNINAKEHYILFLLNILVCKTVIELTQIFPSILVLYESVNDESKFQIEFFYQFATDSSL
jgi:hypothetical protein